MARILIVDDEESVRRVLSIQIRRMGHEAVEAENGMKAWEILQKEDFSSVITDLKMPEMDGLELLQKIRNHRPQTPVIMITAHGTVDTAVEAMKRGAFDYVTKPFNQGEFLKTLERAIQSSENLKQEFQRSRAFLRQDEKIIGQTEVMERVYSAVEQSADSNASVMMTGEPGSGKEVIVRLLHEKSQRREKPLVRAFLSSCPPSDQMEKLFGSAEKPGWVALAEDGSLYLDEIGSLSLDSQEKLFQMINSGEIRARIIAASDSNLVEQIDRGAFRKDLFYALNMIPIYIPPLRERTQDIEPLVDHFIKVFARKFQKNVQGIDDAALHQLVQYSWPGNIRELESCIEYAVNVTDAINISSNQLPASILGSGTKSSTRVNWAKDSRELWKTKVAALEKETVLEALKSSQNDLLRASQKLGVPPSLLEERIRNLKIASVN